MMQVQIYINFFFVRKICVALCSMTNSVVLKYNLIAIQVIPGHSFLHIVFIPLK